MQQKQLTGPFALAVAIAVIAAGCTQDSTPEANNTANTSSQPGTSSEPSPGSNDAAERRAVVAETLAYAEVDEQLVKGHFVFPEDMVDPLPAVILVHEWWGLDDHVRGLADRLASEGFIVLAVDLYNSSVATTPQDARTLMLTVVENPQFAEENIHKAFDWVLETTGANEVAVVGYGFGGGWSLHAAMTLTEKVDAAVILYGQVSTNDDALQSIEAPILAFFGEDDSAVPVDSVQGFEAALERLRKDYEIEIIRGAKGGFASPGNRNFDAQLESQVWERVVAFLHENLVPDEDES